MLHLPAQATEARYAATVTWETFANGAYEVATIQKEVHLFVQPNGQGYALDFRTSGPALTKPEDLEPLENMALRLSALYEWVSVQAAPTGEVGALLNHEALLQTWTRLSQEVQAATPEEDQVTSTMLQFLTAQVQSPASFLRSLQHDYLYQTLLPAVYEQPLSSTGKSPRTRQFSNFFDKTSLWFLEQLVLLPTSTTEHLLLRLSGNLDAQKTDLTAVHEHIAQDLHLATGTEAAALPAPHFHYEATYRFELTTGLPASIELILYARAGQLYSKAYTLTISRV